MSLDLSSRQILNKLLEGKVLTIEFFDKQAYDSIRVALIKAFKKHGLQFESLGVDNPYEGKFIQARFDAAAVSGTFRLEDDQRKSNIRGKVYTVVKVDEL